MIPSCGNLANEMDASTDNSIFAYGQSIKESISLPYTEMDSGELCKA